jgi:hypothetical protein
LAPFSLVGGLRGEIIEVDSDNLSASPASNFTKEFTSLTGRIGGVFDVCTNLSLYAQYCTAAKPTTTLLVLDEANKDFQLERGKMVEVGMKHSLRENRLEWTLALYQIWKANLVTRDPVSPTQNIQIGAQSSHGIELGLAARPPCRPGPWAATWPCWRRSTTYSTWPPALPQSPMPATRRPTCAASSPTCGPPTACRGTSPWAPARATSARCRPIRIAIYGYSKRVELLSRRADGWHAETIFHDIEKGHWLAAAELDGRNNTREIIGTGYGGRIFYLSRPPGYGRK